MSMHGHLTNTSITITTTTDLDENCFFLSLSSSFFTDGKQISFPFHLWVNLTCVPLP